MSYSVVNVDEIEPGGRTGTVKFVPTDAIAGAAAERLVGYFTVTLKAALVAFVYVALPA